MRWHQPDSRTVWPICASRNSSHLWVRYRCMARPEEIARGQAHARRALSRMPRNPARKRGQTPIFEVDHSFEPRRAVPRPRSRLFVVTHAATLAADHRDIGFLWNRIGGARLREIVGNSQDRACLRGIEDALAKRVVIG